MGCGGVGCGGVGCGGVGCGGVGCGGVMWDVVGCSLESIVNVLIFIIFILYKK